MKKKLIIIALIICTVSLVFAMSGCSQTMTVSDAYKNMMDAYNLSLEQDIYYYKQKIFTGEMLKNLKSMNVNVYSPLIKQKKEYVFEYDELGRYKNLAVDIWLSDYDGENTKKTETNYYFAGKVNTKSDKKNYKDIIQYTKTLKDGTSSTQYVEKDAYALIESQIFKSKYALSNLIRDIGEIQESDIIFDAELHPAHTASRSMNVVNFCFSLKEEYFTRFLEKYGEESSFKGGDRIFVETAYDRLSDIQVYRYVDKNNPKIEDEIYDLKMVYYGPKLGYGTVDYSKLMLNENLIDEIIAPF